METAFDFETEYTTEDEVMQALDSLILSTGEAILEEDSKDAIINPLKVQQISSVYKAMKYLTRGKKVDVTYTLHEPFNSVGCVSLLGRDISFVNTDWFSKVCKVASNIDIYPRTDGKVKIDLTFHGLTKPIE